MGIPGIPTIILWKNSREDWLTFTVSGEPHVHPPGVLVVFFYFFPILSIFSWPAGRSRGREGSQDGRKGRMQGG